jgi:hypothetical protein
LRAEPALDEWLAKGWADDRFVGEGLWWKVCNARFLPFVFVFARGRRRWLTVHYDLIPTDRGGADRPAVLDEEGQEALRALWRGYVARKDRSARRSIWRRFNIVGGLSGFLTVERGDEGWLAGEIVRLLRGRACGAGLGGGDVGVCGAP